MSLVISLVPKLTIDERIDGDDLLSCLSFVIELKYAGKWVVHQEKWMSVGTMEWARLFPYKLLHTIYPFGQIDWNFSIKEILGKMLLFF